MSVTDQTILSEMQRITLEGSGDGGATWPSGMWNSTEVIGYLNQRQNRFLAATGLFWTVREDAVVVAQAAQPHPTNWAATVFVAYRRCNGPYVELPKMDQFELDLALVTWPGSFAFTPRGYYEADNATRTLYLAPTPTDEGAVLERYYVALGTTVSASGVIFSVSDEFVPTLKYGALAEMFGKVGPAQNLVLAQAAEERWEEGVELGKLMAQEGWFTL